MAGTRRKFDEDLKAACAAAGPQDRKPIARVARELGVHQGPWATGAPRIAAATMTVR